jgi:hypothetical protein
MGSLAEDVLNIVLKDGPGRESNTGLSCYPTIR